MNYWVFIVTQKKIDGETLSGEEILRQWFEDRFWGLGERTPNRRSLQKGDQAVFYVGMPSMVFAGVATLASDPFTLPAEQKHKFSHGKKFYSTDYGILLDNIRMWEPSRSVKDLLPHLKFIENKENWFAYFQGGVRQLSEDDFRVIAEERAPSHLEGLAKDESIVSDSQFALEAHLEEFIDRNWENIDFGLNLVGYEVDDQTGRQFPAGPWSIDFLCVDKSAGDFVVLELKRGRSSDAAVGQLLRYMGWVEENLAKPGQKVRGIIIAKEVDESLRYAVRNLADVSVLTYRVDFKLSPFDKFSVKSS